MRVSISATLAGSFPTLRSFLSSVMTLLPRVELGLRRSLRTGTATTGRVPAVAARRPS